MCGVEGAPRPPPTPPRPPSQHSTQPPPAVRRSVVQVVIAESYGGRDEPVDVLGSSLVDVGAELLAAPLRLKDLPSQSTYQLFEEEGALSPRAT
jgi:flavorubredoxin